MRDSMRENRLTRYLVRASLCTLILVFLLAGTALAEDRGSGISFENAGNAIIEVMENENSQPGYIKTEFVFSEQAEVEEFATYFYKQFYYGSIPVKVCYMTYSNMPGQYILSVYTEKPQEAARQHRAAEKKLEEAVAGMSAQEDYDKAMEIYRWTYDNFEYDYSFKSTQVYSAFETGETVCNGYTRIFQALCIRRGLECEIVYSENHAWNRVLMNDQWRYVDITWNKNLSEDRWLFLKENEMSSLHKPLEV